MLVGACCLVIIFCIVERFRSNSGKRCPNSQNKYRINCLTTQFYVSLTANLIKEKNSHDLLYYSVTLSSITIIVIIIILYKLSQQNNTTVKDENQST